MHPAIVGIQASLRICYRERRGLSPPDWASFPGSAWERAARDALPRRAPAGRACKTMRSQAEPGNEKAEPLPGRRFMFDFASLRSQFPGLQQQRDGRTPIFFDGPAGTQMPQRVIDAMVAYMTRCNAN